MERYENALSNISVVKDSVIQYILKTGENEDTDELMARIKNILRSHKVAKVRSVAIYEDTINEEDDEIDYDNDDNT